MTLYDRYTKRDGNNFTIIFTEVLESQSQVEYYPDSNYLSIQ